VAKRTFSDIAGSDKVVLSDCMDFDENVFGNDHAKRVRGSDSRTQLADAWFEAQSAWTLCVAFRQNVDRDIRVALANISRKSKIDRSYLELPSSTSPNYLVSLCACISRLESSVLQLNVLFIIYKWIMQTFSSCQSQSQSLTDWPVTYSVVGGGGTAERASARRWAGRPAMGSGPLRYTGPLAYPPYP